MHLNHPETIPPHTQIHGKIVFQWSSWCQSLGIAALRQRKQMLAWGVWLAGAVEVNPRKNGWGTNSTSRLPQAKRPQFLSFQI